MHLNVQRPDGDGQAVVPFDGIHDELALVKSLIMTLVAQRASCFDEVTLTVDLDGVDAGRLVAVARLLGTPAARRHLLVH